MCTSLVQDLLRLRMQELRHFQWVASRLLLPMCLTPPRLILQLVGTKLLLSLSRRADFSCSSARRVLRSAGSARKPTKPQGKRSRPRREGGFFFASRVADTCVRRTYKVAYLNEVRGTFFYLSVPQLELNQGKSAVWQMQYAVGLQSVTITIVRKSSADCRSVHAQVAYAQRLPLWSAPITPLSPVPSPLLRRVAYCTASP